MSDGKNTTDNNVSTHGVVVGVDGSKRSFAAAVWGLREAERRNLPLTLVCAYTMPMFPSASMDAGQGSMEDNALASSARQITTATVDKLREKVGDISNVEVRTAIELGDPSNVLVDYSKNAELLVAGPRGRGGFLGLLVGSVSRSLPSKAHCPVVLVPVGAEETRADQNAPVVVGSDGSEQGRVAMLHAAEEAEHRGAPLRLITVMAPLSSGVEWLPSTVDQKSVVEEMQSAVDNARNWLQSHFPNLTIESEVIDGVPVDVMVKESETARLVVVGTRGMGGFTGALLGSTSQGIAANAKGPVMVVPYHDDPRINQNGN